MSIKNKMRQTFRDLNTLDLRSLALFRVCLGGTILLDLGIRGQSLVAHYTHEGVLPLASTPKVSWLTKIVSPYLISDHPYFVTLLFCLAGFSAAAMVLGYRPRLFAALSFLLLISLQNRNSFLTGGPGLYLRILLFWSIFLPLDGQPDRVLAGKTIQPKNGVLSAATFCYLLQIASVYFFAVIFKLNEPAWLQGSAMFYFLSFGRNATALGAALTAFPLLLKAMNYLGLFVEAIAPFLIFYPFRIPVMRAIAVINYMMFHVLIEALFNVGIFSVVGFVAWIPLIPATFWDGLLPFVRNKFKPIQKLWTFALIQKERLQGLVRRPGRIRGFSQEPSLPQGARFAINTLLVVFLTCGLLSSIDFLPGINLFKNQKLQIVVLSAGHGQNWPMFGNVSRLWKQWLVISGELSTGEVMDLLSMKKGLSWEMPDSYQGMSSRWIAYLDIIATNRFSGHLKLYSRYLCRKWEGKLPLKSVTIYQVTNRKWRQQNKKIFREKLSTHQCAEFM